MSEDYYKKEYERTYKLLQESKRKAMFYSGIVYFFSGAISTLVYVFFVTCVISSIYWLTRHWGDLSVSDKVGIALFSFTIIGGVIRYRSFIFNWPEELYLRTLRKEKEIEELKK